MTVPRRTIPLGPNPARSMKALSLLAFAAIAWMALLPLASAQPAGASAQIDVIRGDCVETVRVTGSNSTGSGGSVIVEHRWTVQGPGMGGLFYGPNAAFTGHQAGAYKITLEIRDANDKYATTSITLELRRCSTLGTIHTDSLPLSPVRRNDLGAAGDGHDDCFSAETQHSGVWSPGASSFDLRLTPCPATGRAAFTLVSHIYSEDWAEKADSSRLSAPEAHLAYADVDADGRYGAEDSLYLSSGASGIAATDGDSFAIRMTAYSNKPPGSLVLPGDPDQVSYNQTATTIPGSYATIDRNENGAVDQEDAFYLLVGQAAGLPSGSALPVNALLLFDGGGRPPQEDPSPPTATTSSTNPTTSPPPPARENVHVEPRSLSFDTLRAAPLEPVRVFVRVANPTTTDANVMLTVEAIAPDGGTAFSLTEQIQVRAESRPLYSRVWTPAAEGMFRFRAYLEGTGIGGPAVDAGAEHADSTRFFIGPLPSDQPLLLFTTGQLNLGRLEPGEARTFAFDVTAYNRRAETVRLDVLESKGLLVQSLTPPVTIEQGQTAKMFLQLRALPLAANETANTTYLVVRALSAETSSNVESMDVVVHEQPTRGLPSLGVGAAAVGFLAAGGASAYFRRRQRGGAL